jgi:hypothetical protein
VGRGLRLAWWAGIELLGLVGWNGDFRPGGLKIDSYLY